MEEARSLRIVADDDVRREIQTLMKFDRKKEPDIELEARFGYSFDGKNVSGFAPGTAREKWYKLINLINESNEYLPMTVEKTLVEMFSDNLRRITNLSHPTTPLLQEKKTKSNLEVCTFVVEGVKYYIRLSKASEKTINTAPAGNSQKARVRTRVSFTAKDNSHRYDFTSIDDGAFEAEIEYLQVYSDIKKFMDPICVVCFVLQGNKTLLTSDENNSAIRGFNLLVRANQSREEDERKRTEINRGVMSQPVNLKQIHIAGLKTYSATVKLNGVRRVGVVTETGFYLIDIKSNVYKMSGVTPLTEKYRKSIFDLEYFKNEIHAFDLLFLKEVDYRNLPLVNRLTALKELSDALGFKMKKFHMSGNIYNDTIEVLKEIKEMGEDDTDGIIYTSLTSPYLNRNTYKWKPPELLTIDFKAARIEGKKYSLQVSTVGNRLVPFRPTQPKPFDGTTFSDTELPPIGEYAFRNGKFVLIRARTDKVTPNFEKIAHDVWEDICQPLEEPELLEKLKTIDSYDAPEDLPNAAASEGEDRDPMRKFHNTIKTTLIEENLKGLEVIDLGAGKGGDLWKYKNSNVKKLFAVEPNKEYLKEFEKRLNASENSRAFAEFKKRVVPIEAKAQETQKIHKEMNFRKVKGAASFFALSFFFETMADIVDLVNTLAATVDVGGYFVGTTIDGQRIRELVGKEEKVKLGKITIVREYKNLSGEIGIGQRLKFQYEGSATVANVQTEYLVDWPLFLKTMMAKGFALQRSNFFDPPSYLTEDQKKFSRLNRSFVFIRASTIGFEDSSDKPSEKKKRLAILESGKTMSFSSPLYQEKNYGLVRTGAVSDGDCFFHAVLMATDPSFRPLSQKEKVKKVESFREGLQIDEKKWSSLGDGQLARTGMGDDLPGFDAIFNKLLLSDSYVQNTMGELKADTILTGFHHDANEKNILDHMGQLEKYLKPQFPSKEWGRIAGLIDQAYDEAFQGFKTTLTTPGEWIGQEAIELISEIVKRDIYILVDDGKAYHTDCAHTRGRKSIVLLYMGKNHYETIGIRNLEQEKTTIQREFEYDHLFIKNIRNQICGDGAKSSSKMIDEEWSEKSLNQMIDNYVATPEKYGELLRKERLNDKLPQTVLKDAKTFQTYIQSLPVEFQADKIAGLIVKGITTATRMPAIGQEQTDLDKTDSLYQADVKAVRDAGRAEGKSSEEIEQEVLSIQKRRFYKKVHNYFDYLEIGCRNGKVAVEVGKLLGVKSITGIDDKKYSKDNTLSGGKFIAADMNKLKTNLPSRSFDIIVLNFVLYQSRNPGAIVEEARRLLKPKGHIILLDHNFEAGTESLINFEHLLRRDGSEAVTLRSATEWDTLFKSKKVLEKDGLLPRIAIYEQRSGQQKKTADEKSEPSLTRRYLKSYYKESNIRELHEGEIDVAVVIEDYRRNPAGYIELLQKQKMSAIPAEALQSSAAFLKHFQDTVVVDNSEGFKYRGAARVREILETTDSKTFHDYLDIGSNDGKLTSEVAKGLNTDSVTGVDVEQYDGKKIKSVLKKFHTIDPKKSVLPFQDGSFDLVTIFQTLHHASDPKKLVSEAHRVLRNGGYLVIREHDARSSDKPIIDFEHILYKDGLDHYHGVYQSQSYWDSLVNEISSELKALGSTSPKGPTRYYTKSWIKETGVPYEVKLRKHKEVTDRLFGEFIKKDLDKIRYTNISIFSTSNADQSRKTAELIKKAYNATSIVDAFSCIGGNTYGFLETFKEVVAVELYALHSEILKNNCKILVGKVPSKVITDSYLEVFDAFKQDVVFMDPPWSKTTLNKDILIGETLLSELVKDIPLQKGIVLKVPEDYPSDKLIDLKQRTVNFVNAEGKVVYKLVFFGEIVGDLPKQLTVTRVGTKYIKSDKVE